jgi:hypothetical protein
LGQGCRGRQRGQERMCRFPLKTFLESFHRKTAPFPGPPIPRVPTQAHDAMGFPDRESLRWQAIGTAGRDGRWIGHHPAPPTPVGRRVRSRRPRPTLARWGARHPADRSDFGGRPRRRGRPRQRPVFEQSLQRVAWRRKRQRMALTPSVNHATRTEFGHPRSSIRLRAWAAMATSVARAWSLWKRSPSPMTCFQRANWPSTRALSL